MNGETSVVRALRIAFRSRFSRLLPLYQFGNSSVQKSL